MHRRDADTHLLPLLELLSQLGQRPVVLFLDQLAHLIQPRPVDLRPYSTTVRQGRKAACRAHLGEIILHSVRRDREALRYFPDAPLAVDVGIDDSLAEVETVRAHGADLGQVLCHDPVRSSSGCSKLG
ncbi:hypothetical protein BE20_49715 [Sorangium cellulosum]|uniref:Uncharacterized protein n=1 Tax=Sorangium cellulosum TaxID=56 RepID=A0A150TDM6_SORCE|nr:hypothetical protein BE18_10115 [Sorangium cellulosum]KYG02781.1 hypothetical protein BE20_49715 [Sorangium cellulosum]